MDNNNILRRIRYSFSFSDQDVVDRFAEGGTTVTQTDVVAWLKREDDAGFALLDDHALATFLNGFIVHRRGPREGPAPVAEAVLNNNIVLRKLKIALDLTSDDILRLLAAGGMELGKPALSALFRKPGHKNYRECQDQLLKKFLMGVQLEYRASSTTGSSPVG